MASKVRVAVLGVGSLGQNHARIYADLAKAGQVEFAGIFDTDADTARKIAARHNTHIFNSIAEAAANADALPTTPSQTAPEPALETPAQVPTEASRSSGGVIPSSKPWFDVGWSE
jgi:predicted dinucleotide-utilizing enzyme